MARKMALPSVRDAGGGLAESEPHSPALRLIAIPTCAAVFVLVMLAVVRGMLGQPPAVIATAAVALVVAVGGIGWVVARDPAPRAALLALTAAGLAGAALIGLLPGQPGYLIVSVALIGLGIEVPPVSALAAGLLVYAAANLAMLLSGGQSLTNLASNDVGAAFLFTVGVFIRYTRFSQARARAAQARAEELLTQLRASQAAEAQAAALTERTRLAREIHDILAHSLSGLVLALDTAELLARRDDAGPETVATMLGQVTRAQRIAREGLADTRRAISALRGDELPGPALLDRLARDTSDATGIRAGLTVRGEQRPLPPEIGLALYRTAQEALINTAKYAGRGGRAELGISYGAEDVELTIQDTRAPDAMPPVPAGLTFGGYGLTGMRERAELLGGRLTAGPAEDGFRVVLWLPAGPVPRQGQVA
ncbi:MAG TPA: histidine kinase [Trebonia sp.]|nr:histidine kinase [Trebonia sp.]